MIPIHQVKYDPQAQAQSSLLTLPLELRYNIYSCLLSKYPPRLYVSPAPSELSGPKNIIEGLNPLLLSNSWLGNGNENGIPSILWTCKQISSEIQDLFLEHTRMFMSRKTWQAYDSAMERQNTSQAAESWALLEDGVTRLWKARSAQSPSDLSRPTDFTHVPEDGITSPPPSQTAPAVPAHPQPPPFNLTPLSRSTIFASLRTLTILHQTASQGDIYIKPLSTATFTRNFRTHFPSLRTLVLRRICEVNVDALYTPDLGRVTRLDYEELSIRRKIGLWRQGLWLAWRCVVSGHCEGSREGRWRAAERLVGAIDRAMRSGRDLDEPEGEGQGTDSIVRPADVPELLDVVYEGEMRVMYGQSWAQEHVETFVYTFPNIAEPEVYEKIDEIISSTARLASDEERHMRVQECSDRPKSKAQSSISLIV